MLETFENAKEMLAAGDGPILVHALTEKGHGYEPGRARPAQVSRRDEVRCGVRAVCAQEAWAALVHSLSSPTTLIRLASGRRAHRRHHGRHGRGNGSRPLSARRVPRSLLRRRHRRAARRDLCRGARRRGHEAGRRDLLHLPAASVRPGRATTCASRIWMSRWPSTAPEWSVPTAPPTRAIYDMTPICAHSEHAVVMAPKDENELQHMLAHRDRVRRARRRPLSRAARASACRWIPELKAIPLGESELLRDGNDVVDRRQSARPWCIPLWRRPRSFLQSEGSRRGAERALREAPRYGAHVLAGAALQSGW